MRGRTKFVPRRPNTQARLFRKLKEKPAKAPPSKRRLFRDEGGGRKLDEWWAKIEPYLLERFKLHRDAGAVVLRSHLYVWVIQICGEVDIDLNQIKAERQWKNFRTNVRPRILTFCKRNKIKVASSQVYKDPQVNMRLKYKQFFLSLSLQFNSNTSFCREPWTEVVL